MSNAREQATAEALMLQFNQMVKGFPVSARWLHRTLECRQPFGLWAHHYIKSRYGSVEGQDYTRDESDWRLTNESAMLAASSSPTTISAFMQVRICSAVTAMIDEPGNEHLRSMEGMMSAAKEHWDQTERLKKLLR